MINWDDIETVLLDMDGTLLDLHFDNYFWLHHLPQRYAAVSGAQPEEVRQQLMSSYDRMRGTLDWYCLDYWSETLGMDVVALKQEIIEKIRLRPDADVFLAWLKNQGKKVLLVTNAHPQSLELKMSCIPIAHHFDALVSSHRFRAPKEEATFWSSLHEEQGFNPASTLFIDDTESVLGSAREFGIAHLLCVLQPDLQEPARESSSYPAFNHFREIFRAE